MSMGVQRRHSPTSWQSNSLVSMLVVYVAIGR